MMARPISVIVVTKNEEARLPRALESLGSAFAEVIVVDSESADKTAAIAKNAGARVVDFRWNGAYPKKRQWCLDNIPLKHDWVFFLDADEEVTSDFIEDLARIDWEKTPEAGFFVSAHYVMNGKALKGGLRNNKLCLLHKGRMMFPPLNDLDIPGMGEIEGHYQPVRKPGYESAAIGRIKTPILHHAFDDPAGWQARHERYAAWEAGMDQGGLWPQDPLRLRRVLKRLFKVLPCRAEAAFLHSYIFKAGFMDGAAGLKLAASRWHYYRMIRVLQKR
ncbi:MAG: glycosyltransferase family 2 protein [Alphaproteobacteria bacterium]|nr:glycosyltransferase family 2 protein [Alphaproteobacteria bacterium]MCD8520424.1 glycosyltransferase family 2 protein [Alphaproteobacteria bacterium]